MKQKVLFKNMRRVLPLCLVCLVAGLVSCNNALDTGTSLSLNLNSPDDSLVVKGIDGCYSAMVICIYPADSLASLILKAPEGLSEDQPLEGQLLRIMKKDLQKSDVMAGDTIEFRIIEYEALYIPPVRYNNRVYENYICRVEPCE